MIKKIITACIFTLGIINFSFATTIIRQNGTYGYSPISNDNDVNVNNKGQLMTMNALGYTRRFLGFASSKQDGYVYFWRSPNNKAPYVYVQKNGRGIQGYYSTFFTCDEITSGSVNIPGNCTEHNYQSGLLNDFFQTITINDFRAYRFDTSRYCGLINSKEARKFEQDICFSNKLFSRSICFKMGSPAGGVNNCTAYEGSLNGTLELPTNTGLNMDMIRDSFIGNPPGFKNNNNNNYICPTIRQLMQNMGEDYNTGLCYNNTTYFNGTTFEQIDKQDIFTIFNDDYQNYTNRISIYWNNCTNANTTQACQNAFSGEYKKYSIISNAINSKVDEKKLRNYCNLGLNYDPNATACVASGGGIKEPYTPGEILDDITENPKIPTPEEDQGTGEDNVLNALDKCENGDRDCYINNRNFIDSLGNIYAKIDGLFKERKNVNGIIPEYILRITFITILFTVVFKK